MVRALTASRRAFVRDVGATASMFAVGGLSACRCAPAEQESSPTTASRPEGPWTRIEFGPGPKLPSGQRAVVRLDPRAGMQTVLVALHGRGEAGRGLDRGARGWRDDYALDAMLARLEGPPVRAEDVAGMIDATRLAAIDASLRAHRFEGLVVACPYTPVPRSDDGATIDGFGAFVTEVLLPEVASLRGAPLAVGRTAIDGVSMGGRWALEVGLRAPQVFGSVGALQPAIGLDDVDAFVELALTAARARPQHLRLATSEEDPFRAPTEALAAAWTKRGLPVRLVVTRGPHDYAWNRGPGALEIALHHERVCRGLTPP